jgi:hypothetical protein
VSLLTNIEIFTNYIIFSTLRTAAPAAPAAAPSHHPIVNKSDSTSTTNNSGANEFANYKHSQSLIMTSSYSKIIIIIMTYQTNIRNPFNGPAATNIGTFDIT